MIPGTTPAQQPKTQIARRFLSRRRSDYFILLAICLPLCYVVITLTHDGYRVAHTADNAWYMNRGDLIWRGILDDAFVYNFLHPTLVGGINRMVNELPRAAIILNWLALSGVIVGTYLLGRVFYNRQIAWLAVLVIGTNLALFKSARLLHPFLLMQAVLVWTVLIAWTLVRGRTTLAAVGLGGMLVLALYTRLEGATYSLLILIAGWKIYQDTHNWRTALRLGIISAVIFGFGLAFYVFILFRNTDAGGGAFSLAVIFRTNPIFWDDLSHRWMETLQYMVMKWPEWAWAVALAGLIWSRPRQQAANWFFASLILLHVAYLFLLSTWPSERYADNSLAFFALLFASALWQFSRYWPRSWPFVPLALVAIMLPGLIRVITSASSPHESYWNYEVARDAQAIDIWLTNQSLQETEVFTLCQLPLSFSYSHFHLIYRLTLTSQSSTTLWNTPAQLLPQLRKQGKLFMTCSQRTWYQDWLDYFENPQAYAEQLDEIGRVGEYIFYRVSQREPTS